MAVKKPNPSERVNTLEQVLIDIWHEAQECDGSRGEQQEALDSIQSLIEDELPDVADYEPTSASDSSDDDESETASDD